MIPCPGTIHSPEWLDAGRVRGLCGVELLGWANNHWRSDENPVDCEACILLLFVEQSEASQ